MGNQCCAATNDEIIVGEKNHKVGVISNLETPPQSKTPPQAKTPPQVDRHLEHLPNVETAKWDKTKEPLLRSTAERFSEINVEETTYSYCGTESFLTVNSGPFIYENDQIYYGHYKNGKKHGIG